LIKWIQISRQHGLEIEDTPKPKEQTGLTLEEYQRQLEEKNPKQQIKRKGIDWER